MEIVWKGKEATPASTSPVTAASQIAGSQQTVFQESGDTISQEKGKVEENIEKTNTVFTPTEVAPATADYHDKLAEEWSEVGGRYALQTNGSGVINIEL